MYEDMLRGDTSEPEHKLILKAELEPVCCMISTHYNSYFMENGRASICRPPQNVRLDLLVNWAMPPPHPTGILFCFVFWNSHVGGILSIHSHSLSFPVKISVFISSKRPKLPEFKGTGSWGNDKRRRRHVPGHVSLCLYFLKHQRGGGERFQSHEAVEVHEMSSCRTWYTWVYIAQLHFSLFLRLLCTK